jgi:hypothetical protein
MYRHLYWFCYVKIFSTNQYKSLLLLDNPGRVRSQIASIAWYCLSDTTVWFWPQSVGDAKSNNMNTVTFTFKTSIILPVCIRVLRSQNLPRGAYASMCYAYCWVDQNETGASRPRGDRARDFVNFRKKNYASRARGLLARDWQFTLPGSRSRTLRPLVLSHAIEKQNSDFVTP